MNLSKINNLISDIVEWLESPNGKRTIRVIRLLSITLPPIVRTIDSWISSASYAEAMTNIKEIELANASLAKQIYHDYYNQMSPVVKQAFSDYLQQHEG